MPRDREQPNELRVPFIFVPHGYPEPKEWMARHPGWVKFPAVMVPRTEPDPQPASPAAAWPPAPMPASLPLHGPVAEVAAVPQPPPTPEPLIDGMTAEAREKFAARNDDPIAAYLAINRYIERVIGPGVQSVRRAATMPEDSDSHPAPATSTSGPPTLPPAAVPPNPTPSPFQTAQYQTCAEFIAENCKASILRVFPGQFLDVPVDDVLDAAKQGDRAAQTAKKLLFENRFRK